MGIIRRAVVSVTDKTGVADLAKRLSAKGVEILSTGGTAKTLREAGVPVKDVSEFTGFPEMLDGRVKTLHPKIHGGLLGRRSEPSHVRQMKEHGIEPIDLLVVNLYPFEATIRKRGVAFAEAVEQIDIGGPAMLRSAAKNHEDVTVVVDPADYETVISEVETSGEVSEATRRRLAAKVFAHTSRYDGMIAQYLSGAGSGETSPFPRSLSLFYEKAGDLRYGENPHQRGAFYIDPGSSEPSVARGRVLHGKAMSYNNYLDANAALELVKEFGDTAAVIVKHNNPCGVALGQTLSEAYMKARETDPVSAFGGVIALNRRVDQATASAVSTIFVEVLVAPGFDPDALDILQKKKDIRLLDVGPTLEGRDASWDFKRITGGLIVQDRDLGKIEDVRKLKVVTQRAPTNKEYEALAFGWVVCKHVKSNAIVYARAGQTVGVGAGQMSRVDSAKIGAMKAQLPLKGSIVASDAFFPFRDGVDECARHGVTALIQPGGSIRDAEVIGAADEHNMAMVFTGMRHFRH